MVLFAVASAAGVLVMAGAGTEATHALAATPPPVPMSAAIAADGTVTTATDGTWTARKVDVGRYELSFEEQVDLAIRSWDEAAVVTVRPRLGDTWLVTFAVDDEPVDSGFRIEAAPLP